MMTPDLLVNLVAAVNAGFVIASVWLLSAGRTRHGNWAGLAAATAGVPLGVLTGAWPLVGLNLVIGLRSAWMLCRRPRNI